MLFVYLDEFGHNGPFVHRQDKQHSTSPVFGLAGIVLPEHSVRQFSSAFLELKKAIFHSDIAHANSEAYKWEKKGSDIFRPKAIDIYEALRAAGFRLVNLIRKHEGKIFYYGRDKICGKLDGNSNGFYTTVLAHSIRRLDSFCSEQNSNFVLVVDQHSARKELLECAAKTMYGRDPARRLLSPPFEVESYLNQPIQAADWIASIVGRMWAYKVLPEQYEDHQNLWKFYWSRLHQLAVHSTVQCRPSSPGILGRRNLKVQKETAMSAAIIRAGIIVT